MGDIFNILSGISFLCYGTWMPNEEAHKFTWVGIGKSLMLLGLMSGICNVLARFGIRIWSRVFLLPYLVFLIMLLTYVFIGFSQSVKQRGVKEVDFLSVVAILVIFYIWQTILRQWVYIVPPRPVMHDGEATNLLRPTS
eukprot:TRINITY_DN21471_c0_g1_i1.p1 TRINITY_DN21471_c0_g1~~TRINITY_DN21471_c0_g1_i1.p1  ORF type:complete len:161 (+),score=33.06 TRINITY_DN21471_c0_g1_i1:67-483(+)